MRVCQLIASLGLCGLSCLPAGAQERNFWPVLVEQSFPDRPAESKSQSVGPLLFRETTGEGQTVHGFRPFYVFVYDSSEHTVERDFLYPLLTRHTDESGSRWSLLELVNSQQPKAGVPPNELQSGFDVWPFYFSRNTGDPAT